MATTSFGAAACAAMAPNARPAKRASPLRRARVAARRMEQSVFGGWDRWTSPHRPGASMFYEAFMTGRANRGRSIVEPAAQDAYPRPQRGFESMRWFQALMPREDSFFDQFVAHARV